MGHTQPEYTSKLPLGKPHTEQYQLSPPLPPPTPIFPIIEKIFCSTCSLNPLNHLLYNGKFDSYESLDSASAGRCEDESLVNHE